MRRSSLLLACVALVVGGCGGQAPVAEPPSPTTSPAPPAASAPAPTTSTAGTTTVVATSATDLVEVRAEPDEAADPQQVLDRRDETSGQLVFVVDEQRGDWLGVQLPVRPNGSTGWVRADDVTLTQHPFSLRIDLSEHRLVVLDGSTEVLTAPVGVGTTDTPTPGGSYYVKELLQPPDADGPYGPYAYGLSGFSNVLTSFAGGEGVIGIHGTNAPDLVGGDVSNGCLRLTNEVVTRLVEEIGLPLGTPVEILA